MIMQLYFATVGIDYMCCFSTVIMLLAVFYRYRKLTDPDMLKVEGSSPAFGIYLGLYNAGTIRVGDSVFVGDEE